MELVRMHSRIIIRNMSIVPVRNADAMKGVKIVTLQMSVMSQKRRNIKMSENPCAFCSEYDADIGAPCFFYKDREEYNYKCPIVGELAEQELKLFKCFADQKEQE